MPIVLFSIKIQRGCLRASLSSSLCGVNRLLLRDNPLKICPRRGGAAPGRLIYKAGGRRPSSSTNVAAAVAGGGGSSGTGGGGAAPRHRLPAHPVAGRAGRLHHGRPRPGRLQLCLGHFSHHATPGQAQQQGNHQSHHCKFPKN